MPEKPKHSKPAARRARSKSLSREILKIPFELKSGFMPTGDQPQAIEKIVKNLKEEVRFQTLRGITGSGKTFTVANVIQACQRPTLVIAPNKTLAAQLYSEFKEFFPENRVKYFVSYYDYYQPEAYIPSTDTYIEKDSAINEEIDKMRHSATTSLLESRDAIIVASVSCIYGLGSPEDYLEMMLLLQQGTFSPREDVLRRLVAMQYKRSELDFTRGTFRVRGETLDVFPSDQDALAIRIIYFGDDIESIQRIDPLTGKTGEKLTHAAFYPVSHFVTGRDSIVKARERIRAELKEHLKEMLRAGKTLESQRLEQRTMYDLELLAEIGFCPGIENYSRHIAGRAEGEPPATLLDYFPEDFLVIVDESHVTVPQIGGMFRGDRARKQSLVEYGFRLPSALDNRPLNLQEFWERVGQCIFVSATPGDYEIDASGDYLIEQINRPTGLLDPPVTVKPALHQVDDLIVEIREAVSQGGRVLVTTLTKKMAEDLSKYFQELGLKARYLHSEVTTIERVEILRGLRKGDFDVLIGINLLREGLDLVEVTLVAILDADKEGFLRSTRSLIQTMGRAARNLKGRVIMYADNMTRSMSEAIAETERRRTIQAEYNEEHNIQPSSAQSGIQASLGDKPREADVLAIEPQVIIPSSMEEQEALLGKLKQEMFEAARLREFEKAAKLRDTIQSIEKVLLYG
jgi:excinuclease ABC subunit B